MSTYYYEVLKFPENVDNL